MVATASPANTFDQTAVACGRSARRRSTICEPMVASQVTMRVDPTTASSRIRPGVPSTRRRPDWTGTAVPVSDRDAALAWLRENVAAANG